VGDHGGEFRIADLGQATRHGHPKTRAALGHGSGANWSLSRWGKSTGKRAEKDMDTALELAQAAKVSVPLGGLVDQLVKGINQDKMKALLS
jgi:3-hydroxyisobutyrate dehydrogenase-like beta-hydroxyacid dehydrogenase